MTILPDAALAQHVAITGRTGSGKTFAAKGFVERLLDQRRRICVIDPTDGWHGLRSSADGRKPGYPVVVFGGDHGDVPINAHNGGAFNNPLANLRSRGWAQGGPDRITITQAGLSALGTWDPLPERGGALQEYWLGALPGPAAKILRVLCEVYPDGLSADELAAKSGYQPRTGGFNNPLARLRSLELATGRGGEPIRASEELF